MKELNFLFQKKIIVKFKDKTIFVLMCFVIKMDLLIQFVYQIKNLKILWIYCRYQMKISLIICILIILTDLCAIKQKIKTKNISANVVYSVLVVNKF